MKKSILYILLAASFSANGQAIQTAVSRNWEPKPTIHAIPPKYFGEHAVYLLNNLNIDYKIENGALISYRTRHFIVKVLDKTGIENFNTQEIGLYTNIDSIKARTILPDGSVRNVTQEMWELKRNSQGGVSLIFAMDAVEKNSEIEVLIKDVDYEDKWGRYYMQYSIPNLNSYINITYPKSISFDFKGYHGVGKIEESISGNRKQVSIYKKDIPALQPEKMSYYNLYRMAVDYRLNYNTDVNHIKDEEFGWSRLLPKIYKNFYSFSKDDTAAAKKILRDLGVRGTESEAEKIKKIEDGIKSNYALYPALLQKGSNALDSIAEYKRATNNGYIKLFAACFTQAGIQHEIGYTANRRNFIVDSKFETPDALNEVVFYFPALDGYLDPLATEYRYPFIPVEYTNNKGVFYPANPERGFQMGRQGAAVNLQGAQIRKIPTLGEEKSAFKAAANISISPDMTVTTDVTYNYSGYDAAEMRYNYSSKNEQDRKDMVLNLVDVAEKRDDIIRYDVSNYSTSAAGSNKPFQIHALVKTPWMVYKAGNDYLIKVGGAIGDQLSMYDIKDRLLPVDIDHPILKKYSITVEIPKGYKLKNAESLKNHVEHFDMNTGDITASFDATYSVAGNKVSINVRQNISKLHYSIYDFDRIKGVINAAVDYSNAGILLEPIKVKTVKKAAIAKKAPAKPLTPSNVQHL